MLVRNALRRDSYIVRRPTLYFPKYQRGKGLRERQTSRGALCGAHQSEWFGINQHHFADAKLAQVVAAWDTLPKSIKADLLTIIQRDGGQT